MSEPPPPPAPPPAPRPLRRSRTDRVIGGVCGGLGRYLGIEPVLLRVAFVVLALAGGGGILVYLVAWVLIPEEGDTESPGTAAPSRSESFRLILGGVLIALGTLLLLELAFPRIGRYLWPLALIGVGVAVIVSAMRR